MFDMGPYYARALEAFAAIGVDAWKKSRRLQRLALRLTMGAR